MRNILYLFAMSILLPLVTLTVAAEEPPGTGAATRPSLTGHWVSNDYRCGDALYTEEVVIRRQGDGFVARKITGDPCVPAGNISFRTQGAFRPGHGVPIVWVSGRPERPASGSNKGSLRLLDDNRLVVHFDPKHLLFERKGTSAPGLRQWFRALREALERPLW